MIFFMHFRKKHWKFWNLLIRTKSKESGIEEEQAEAFVKSMEDVKELNLGNLVDKSKMTITLPDATIKIPAQYAYRLEVKEIDGRMYAAFPIDENYIEVNGIAVKAR